MNELTNSIPKDGRSLSDLLESSEFDPAQWRVRRTAGTIVLERIGEPAGIPPGSYTPETLPPLSDGARAILASVAAAVAAREAAPLHRREPLVVEDPAPSFTIDDDALPGFDPDR